LRAAWSHMSFRRRIALASAAAVAIAVVLASLLTYLLTSNQLHSQVDSQLRNRARTAGRLQRFLRPGHQPAAVVTDSERLGLDLNGLDSTSKAQPQGATVTRTGGDGASAKNLFGRLPPGPDQGRGYQQG